MMKNSSGLIAALAVMMTTSLSAQGVQQTWWTIEGGGTARSTGGGFELGATIGQFDAGRLTTGSIVLTGGVWFGDDKLSPNPIRFLSAVPGPDRVLVKWSASQSGAVDFLLERRTTGAFAYLAALGLRSTGDYSLLDKTAVNGSIYTYRITERFMGGVQVPRATVMAKPYSLGLPTNMARVGPGGFASIAAAIAAAPAGQIEWVVSVQPGTYPAFSVGPTAPRVLRIVADETGKVVIDTSQNSLRIDNRTAGQTVELRGVEVGDSSSGRSGIYIASCQGVVIIDSTIVDAGATYYSLIVQDSTSVAIQNCVLAGGIGLYEKNSTAAVSHSQIAGFYITNQSTLTTAEVTNSGVSFVVASSTHNALTGPMPAVDSYPFTAPDFPFDVDIVSGANSPFALFLALDNGWLELPSIEMVLLLDSTAMVPVSSGATNQSGEATVGLDFSSIYSQFYGRSLELQAVSVDPGSGTLRLSNVLTKIGLR